jgi:tetratricopeptide (TPR) repeat protein
VRCPVLAPRDAVGGDCTVAAPRIRSWITIVTCALSLGACASTSPNPRSLHYVDGELVHSRPPHARAYEAYLRARVALESDPPQIDEALELIGIAIHYDPREPQLWTTRAEIEAEAGEIERALVSAARALELRPGYTPAQRLIATLGRDRPATAATDTGRQP